MRSRLKAVAGLALTIVLVCASAYGQGVAGQILGSVTDQTGAALAGATVIVTDINQGTSRTLTTDGDGNYAAPNLVPSVYKIRASSKGFRSTEREGVQLEVAKDLRIDLTLQPGQVSDTVVVNEEIPLLDVTSSTLGGTLSNREINDLPLNGRNYENLLQLRPGVVRYPGGGFSTTSTNGLRAEDNAYVIDGLFNSEPYSGQGIINGAGIAGDSATILPIDSIQEFNLEENPRAEFGWKPGAIVNVGLKSGSNTIHGTIFGFGRDGVTDARNYFNTAPNPKLGRTLEQFGASVGGPIVRDKIFFFGAYEGQRYNVGNSFGGVTSPSMVGMPSNGTCLFVASGDCADSIPNAITDLQAGGIPVSAASLKVAGCTLGPPVTCTGTGFPTNTNPTINIVNGFNNIVHVDNTVGKVDYHFNEKNTFNGMYFFGNNSGTVEDFPELQQNWLSKIHTRAQVVGGSWVYVPGASWVNEARFGYNRLYQPTLPGDLGTPASAYGLNTGVQAGPYTGGLPRIGFGGYFFPGLGGFKWPKLQGPDTITQFIDHVSYVTGKHSFKFGGEIHRDSVTGGAFGNARGSLNFLGGTFTSPSDAAVTSSQLEDFFAGAPTLASVLSGNPIRQLHNWAYAGFVQDDWRITRTLTLNLGVRYEYNSVVKEAHNLIGNFDPNLGLVQVGKQISGPYNPDRKNFAPRFGFAWDVTGQGNTVVRGGVGISYETVNWQSFLAFNNSFGLASIPTGATIDAAGNTAGGTILVGNLSPTPPYPWDNGPIFGNLSPSNLSCDPVNANPCAIMGVDQKLTTPYVTTWNVNIQHSFGPNVTLEVGYVGNHGTNLTGIRDINQPPVGSGYSSLCATDPNCEQDSRPLHTKFPYLSNIFQMGNVYKSNYDGLQATLTSRNYHGLNMVAGYTYAHALDDVGANWDFGYGAGLPQDSYHVGREYASSDFDVRHRLTLSMTYLIPGKKGAWQMLQGWELNSIVTLESAQPWGPIDLGTDVSGTGPLPVSPPASSPNRWDFYGDPNDFRSGPTPIPYYAGGSTNMPAACTSHAAAIGATPSLNAFGCFAKGSSVMIPPAFGTFGTMGRNSFPDSGFRNWDFSVSKNFKFGERLGLQGRVELFNILNHPNFANPYGGQNGYGQNDPSAPGSFGCGCATPDVAAANPVVGSGGSRAIQFGLKFLF
jgi:Carboxypeptidase regulatory-like domain/TonB dependent receptor